MLSSTSPRLLSHLQAPALLAAFLMVVSWPQPLAAEDMPDVAMQPPASDATLEARGARIGNIEILVSDVFDPDQPGEDRRLFRAANKLHINTRKQVIARQLLFRSGDRFSRQVLDETERLLRTDRYLYDATIKVARDHGDTVDLVVETRDVWTLKLGLGVGRSGGANTSHFELEDANLFGTGKGLLLRRENTIDRTSTELRYDDHNLFGSRAQLSLSWRDNSDGSQRSFRLERPFFSLDTKWAAAVTAFDDNRIDSLYQLGKISAQFRHQQQRFDLSAGRSKGLVDGWARRFSVGFTFLEDRFAPLAGAAVPATFPEDRTLSFPWLGFDLAQDRFIEEHNLDQLHRTEDLSLGRELHLRLGLATAATGSDHTALVFDGGASAGFQPGRRQTLTTELRATGRWGEGGGENLLVTAAGRYYLRDFGDQLFVANLEAAATHHPDAENQLLLGGDNGLRGYPLRYQGGDRRLLLSLEQRWFSHHQPFHLLHFGAAVFYDLGRTWGNEAQFGKEFGWLQDVGVGLRLASSRSHHGSVIHLDLAFPLGGGNDLKNVQYLVTTKARL